MQLLIFRLEMNRDIKNIIYKYLLPNKIIIRNKYTLCLNELVDKTKCIKFYSNYVNPCITKIYYCKLRNIWTCNLSWYKNFYKNAF